MLVYERFHSLKRSLSFVWAEHTDGMQNFVGPAQR
jgi:hypothetical protein